MNIDKIKVISFYHFFRPDFNLEIIRMALRQRMMELNIKGSILLAQEGINSSVAGLSGNLDLFMEFLLDNIRIADPVLKISFCNDIPFKRALIKIKPSIVCEPGTKPVDLTKKASPYISPSELHQWIEKGKNMVLLDTRNDYEYQTGRFKNSVHLGTKHFADFEQNLKNAPQEWKNIPIVTFCTGGIRCEKASPLMIQKGFREVYQLEGGILNYFEKVGRGHFEGTCFVFDQRISLDEQLNPAVISCQESG